MSDHRETHQDGSLAVTMVTGIFPPDIGGPASYVPAMARALTARGHSVHVITLSDAAHHDDRDYAFAVTRIRRSLPKPCRVLVTARAIHSAARRSDLVFAAGLALEATAAGLAAGVPVLHKVVGDIAWERARSRGWYPGSIDEYQRAAKGYRLRLLDHLRAVPLRHGVRIIVPSEYLRRMVVGWGVRPDLVDVIYNAVERTRGAPAVLADFGGPTITTVCRLVAWKGVDRLIRLAARLTGVRLVVVGDGPLRPAHEALAVDLGVRDRVVFTGSLPRESVAGILAQSTLFVLNSSYEGLPHVVLEAMSAGVPVIATDVGGTAELVEDGRTGRLIPDGDDQALLQSVTSLLAEPGLRHALIEGGRERLRRDFSFAGMVRRTESLLLAYRGSAERGGRC